MILSHDMNFVCYKHSAEKNAYSSRGQYILVFEHGSYRHENNLFQDFLGLLGIVFQGKASAVVVKICGGHDPLPLQKTT